MIESERTMNWRFRSTGIALFAASLSCFVVAQTTPGADATPFAPLDQWKNAVLAGDPAGLSYLYSTSPAVKVDADKGASDAASETNFWIGLKAKKIDLDVIQRQSPQTGVQVFVFQATVSSANDTVYVTEAQAWQQQGDSWKLVVIKHTQAAHLQQPPSADKNIYPDSADAKKEIKDAEEKAGKGHKRVLLVFGANWCYDCHVLDLAFHRPDFVSVMAGYEVVHVDIGQDGKKNADLANQYQVPLEKGVPALAVLESDGKLLVSQKNGEFENARAMTPQALLEFLDKWKLEAR